MPDPSEATFHSTLELTDNDYFSLAPQINNNGQVVWYGREGCSDTEIFLYDESAITQLNSNNYANNEPPQINNSSHVVWRGFVGGYSQIFYALPSIDYLETSITSLSLPPKYEVSYLELLKKIDRFIVENQIPASISKLNLFKKRISKHMAESFIPEETAQDMIEGADTIVDNLLNS